MHKKIGNLHFLKAACAISAGIFIVAISFSSAAYSQVAGLAERNMSQMSNEQNECSIVKNPTNKAQLFAACNNHIAGLFAARSIDGGATWIYPDPSKTIANGVTPALGPAACCDPTLAWDTFGNLFITYVDWDGGLTDHIVTLLSTDAGVTFSTLASFGPASIDQPTIAADAGQVWIVWNQSGAMVARGAPVTGLGAANIGAFIPLQNIPGTANCSFGDISISPGGAVVQTCETLISAGGLGPENILINIKADGVGPGPFGAAITATSTNVGGFKPVPAQSRRTVDAEPGLAYDRNDGTAPHANPPSPHLGRLYLVYTDETVFGSNNTDIMVRSSDNDGATWSAPVKVNDDATTNSQFLPRIASNRLSGNIAVCWHDSRNSASNNTMQEFCSIATPTGATPSFMPNAQVSAGASNGNGSNPPISPAADIQFGDYSGLTYFQGLAHPAWADDSNSTGDNPDGTARYDAYTNEVTGGAAAHEGDPHLTTVNGVHYDFQGAGEFTVLRDYDGLEIQTRQSPISTTFNPGADPHDGLATCVSLNTAVAARVGKHRVSYEPNISGVPDPSGMQLRVDGVLKTLGPAGIDLGDGGRIVSSPAAAGAIEVDFPDETAMFVTPGWWPSQSKWYLNVDVSHTPALEGVLGVIRPGAWLPSLPNGASMGSMPAALHQRYLDLYKKFAPAWRVTNKTSLFDYKPGTSTATFTFPTWPLENPPCVLPKNPPVKPANLRIAEEACRRVENKRRHADCVFDVRVTGNLGFAKTYLQTELIEADSTTTTVTDDKDPTRVEEPVTFTASVTRASQGAKGVPSGTIQFMLDGHKAGDPVRLDGQGHAAWKTSNLKPGIHKMSASYTPSQGSAFLASSSLEQTHTVKGDRD